MSIFSRRLLQQMIDENAAFLTEKQLQQQVSKLNANNFQALDTEWEVAVLNAFSKIGVVEHEPDLTGSSKLDLLFISGVEPLDRFVADITAVSDEGFEDESPLKFFDTELQNQINKSGLRANAFGYEVNDHSSEYAGDKITLMLPRKNEFHREIFNSQFKNFLRSIEGDYLLTHKLHIKTAKTDVVIWYEPDQPYFRSHYSVYTHAVSKTKNPIYGALKYKAQQIKKADYAGWKGIVLCDGGCDVLNRSSSYNGKIGYDLPAIIKEFFRQHQSIDFVLVLSSVYEDCGSRIGMYKREMTRRIKVLSFRNESCRALPANLENALSDLKNHFPIPKNTAYGARETIRGKFDQMRFRPLTGGFTMKEKELTVSANAVFALLAGVVTQEEFFASHGWSDGSAACNLFKSFLSRKMKFSEVRLEKTAHDDDQMVFVFEDDPAVTPFNNPKSK